ncbi:tRNA (5-methylaminomethyl-2-thiouridine)(34)-methyltransferase MnmD [Hyphobacterium sp.]|jgi:tRNA 5-methylaminomethyl-2-thiouridine biosynthesis bifunctional protein|uniref:tRNA (5-methylaminomethyl-2-thiouridine)(34)-methyltransferase MnmD n=1 Tax=Hyphobacterium sp. TaxID=2004662 RepID=UPI003BA9E983
MKLYCDPPALDWRETGPVARDFGDIYFSAEDGLAETRFVFLSGCGLPQGWQGRERFTIGELGFGTGLNFLAAWQLWRETGPKTGWLHFVSVEKFPLRRDDARRALSAWPELAPLADQLIAQWPQPIKGAHRRRFEADRVSLTLIQDDVASALTQIEADVDAWFLDGFAPSGNAEMWSDNIWPEIARLSRPGARAATFTVAGAVRRGLRDAGFSVEKKPGFGRKRERLEAVFGAPAKTPPPTPFPRLPAIDGRILIRGGGIAGASLAYALRRRGRDVVILDPGGLAAGASGAPSGLLTPRLENADRPHVRATLAAFDYARQLFSNLGVFVPEGALRLLADDAETARYTAIANAMGEGYEIREDGLWMDRAGRFSPHDVVAALAGDVPVVPSAGRVPGTAFVIDARGFQAALDDISASAGRLAVFDGAPPPHPIVWGGYVSATGDGRVLIGATHEKGEAPGNEAAAIVRLRSDLEQRGPDIAASLSGEGDSWSGVRATAPDRLPAAGTLPDARFDTIWRDAARGGRWPEIAEQPAPGVMLSGLGSRGFAHAPLLAEALASDLCGEPSPLEQAGREALHPARFRWRALRRGQ